MSDARIHTFEQHIQQAFHRDERCQRIAQVGGVGEVSATALVAANRQWQTLSPWASI